MPVTVRPYAPGDETAICALFETVFGRPMSVAYWAWRYRDHPSGGPLAELCWDGDRLAGHYAVCASDLAVNGSRIRASMSMTTMVHPDYRGQRLFEISAEQLYGRLEEDNRAMVLGFPNAMSHRGFVGRLGWSTIYELPTMALAVAAAGKSKPVPASIEPVAAFDGRFDAFWDGVRARCPIWTWRDAAYLTWRFTNNPDHAYRTAACVEGGRILGYAVIKEYQGHGIDLVDLMAFDAPVIDALVAWVVDQARQRDLGQVATWCQPQEPARLQLESLGFKAGGPVTYFGARAFRAMPAGVDGLDHRNWRLAMSDSDVF